MEYENLVGLFICNPNPPGVGREVGSWFEFIPLKNSDF